MRPTPYFSNTPREIFDSLGKTVIGQEDAKRAMAVAWYYHQRGHKQNVLLVGPSGSGKTLIAQTVAAMFQVPHVIADATEYTAAGYAGKSVSGMLVDLVQAANHDVHHAEGGIVIVDEVDKLAARDYGVEGVKDVGGAATQEALLKLMEGKQVTGDHENQGFRAPAMNTAKLMFVFAGAFTDIPAVKAGDTLRTEDFIRYGMLPEFMGRVDRVAQLKPLKEGDLVTIIEKSDKSPIHKYRSLLASENVRLEVTPAAYKALAARALEQDLGARGLSRICSSLFEEVLFTAPEKPGTVVKITPRHVKRIA